MKSNQFSLNFLQLETTINIESLARNVLSVNGVSMRILGLISVQMETGFTLCSRTGQNLIISVKKLKNKQSLQTIWPKRAQCAGNFPTTMFVHMQRNE